MKTSNEDVPNLINMCPTNPIQVLKLQGFVRRFYIFYYRWLNDTFDKNIKQIDVGTGVPQQRQEVYLGLSKYR